MQRSSPSIAALATALAKAQIELTNPEKSLTGTIEPQRGQGGARQFRYATPPWSVEEQAAALWCATTSDQVFAYVYYESEPGR